MEDLISKEKAYKVLSEYYHHKTEMQHKALREALDRVPSAEPSPENCCGCNCPKMVPSATQTNAPNTLNALDCVSRQDAITLMCKALHYNYEEGYAVTQMLALPSADIDLSDYSDRLWRKAYEQGKADAESEIIRCKDCKYASLTYDGDCKYCSRWDEEYEESTSLYLDGDFYCGFAERKE